MGQRSKDFLFLLPMLDKQEQKTASYTGASKSSLTHAAFSLMS